MQETSLIRRRKKAMAGQALALSPRKGKAVARIRLDQHNWHFYSRRLHSHPYGGSAKMRPSGRARKECGVER